MLSRLYLDNFRCFVNFEHRPARRELIFGRNESGKSSLLDALLWLRQVAVRGDAIDDFFILGHRTRWLDRPQIIGELEAELSSGRYLYRLVVEPRGEQSLPRVVMETVHFDGKPIFEFTNGE